MNLKKLQQYVLYLLIFLIPCNLAKHWPQDWSYVNGILVDYLIPTLYLTDILILVLLGAWFLEKLGSREYCVLRRVLQKEKKFLRPTPYLLLAIIYLLLNILVAVNWQAAIYKWIKVLEFGLLILWIRKKGPTFIVKPEGKVGPLHSKRTDPVRVRPLRTILSLSVIWQSVWAIGQWIKQGSIFGYWFFGEQPFNTSTLGIKKIFFLGEVKVLPMGTFPHPNVLAGFLVISLLLILVTGRRSFIKISTLVLGGIGLGLTFSLPAWIAFIGGIAYCVLRRVMLAIIILLLVIIAWGKNQGWVENYYSVSSWSRRGQLNKIAFDMWQSSPIFGVGLNNFIPRMEEFGFVTANYRFLQPVHNVLLLILSEMGTVGIILITYGLVKAVKAINPIKSIKSVKTKKKSLVSLKLLMLLVLLFLGAFDHYWLTIQQGMLTVTIILSLSSQAGHP